MKKSKRRKLGIEKKIARDSMWPKIKKNEPTTTNRLLKSNLSGLNPGLLGFRPGLSGFNLAPQASIPNPHGSNLATQASNQASKA